MAKNLLEPTKISIEGKKMNFAMAREAATAISDKLDFLACTTDAQ